MSGPIQHRSQKEGVLNPHGVLEFYIYCDAISVDCPGSQDQRNSDGLRGLELEEHTKEAKKEGAFIIDWIGNIVNTQAVDVPMVVSTSLMCYITESSLVAIITTRGHREIKWVAELHHWVSTWLDLRKSNIISKQTLDRGYQDRLDTKGYPPENAKAQPHRAGGLPGPLISLFRQTVRMLQKHV
ncbi:hypothetical protein B0H17DRAFT_1133653 [Mycena rosella]|uniref:Uncharacterized protein n=1 Tax=Mycena rosella TaxID=1033263 RepID=A0AAD7DHR8_MYCRO|nr:hypothetical protein B0H17DRAFT_1133653 [Mycena rosella]